MNRHLMAAALLAVGAVVLGAMSLGAASGCGGCFRCAGTASGIRVTPTLHCAQAYSAKVEETCACEVTARVHNGCDTELLVGVGHTLATSCFEYPRKNCLVIPPGETSEVRQFAESAPTTRFPLWKDEVRYEIVIDTRIDWDG